MGHDIIVIGASAGGVEAITELFRCLPKDLPAAIFVVVHFPPQSTSMLPDIINRIKRLPAHHAQDYETIHPGVIYIARPDYHLLVERDYVRVVRGPRENRHRPSVDALFRTAARAYDRRVIGVVLSGTLDDGTAGLQAIKAREGIAVVQDPSDALFSGMPQSAIAQVPVDYVTPLAAIPDLLSKLAHAPISQEGAPTVSHEMEIESDIAELDMSAVQTSEKVGNPSPFSCPECGGVLWEIQDGELIRYRCRVGHALSADALLIEQSDAVETALWVALRALEERASLEHRMASRAQSHGQRHASARFDEEARDAEQHAATIRRLLLNGGDKQSEPPTEAETSA